MGSDSGLARSEHRCPRASQEGRDCVLWAQCVVLSRRFVVHAAADGGRWAGLHGCCDCSRIPRLLSRVVCETVIFEK